MLNDIEFIFSYEGHLDQIYKHNARVPDMPADRFKYSKITLTDDYKLVYSNKLRSIPTGIWIIKYVNPTSLYDAFDKKTRIKYKDLGDGEIYLNELSTLRERSERHGHISENISISKYDINSVRSKAILYFLNKFVFWTDRKSKVYVPKPSFMFEYDFFHIFEKQYGPLLIKALYTNDDKDWNRIGLVGGINLNISANDLFNLFDSYYDRNNIITSVPIPNMINIKYYVYTVYELVYFFDLRSKLNLKLYTPKMIVGYITDSIKEE